MSSRIVYERLAMRRCRKVQRWGVTVVRGRSMAPTLADGDRLWVRYGARPSVGKVAVVRLPSGVLAVKRLAFVDGADWWVERDNPAEGVDSWSVGSIPVADVLAVAAFVCWPPSGVIRWLADGGR